MLFDLGLCQRMALISTVRVPSRYLYAFALSSCRHDARPYPSRDSRSVSPQVHKPIAKSNSVADGLTMRSHVDLSRNSSLVENASNTLSPYPVQQRRARLVCVLEKTWQNCCSTSTPGMAHSPHQLSVDSTGSCTSSQLSITNSTHGIDAWSVIRTQVRCFAVM